MTFSRNAGYRLELAWTRCRNADALPQCRSAESRRAVRPDTCGPLLQTRTAGPRPSHFRMSSLTISTELGMRPLMDQVLSGREVLRGLWPR